MRRVRAQPRTRLRGDIDGVLAAARGIPTDSACASVERCPGEVHGSGVQDEAGAAGRGPADRRDRFCRQPGAPALPASGPTPGLRPRARRRSGRGDPAARRRGRAPGRRAAGRPRRRRARRSRAGRAGPGSRPARGARRRGDGRRSRRGVGLVLAAPRGVPGDQRSGHATHPGLRPPLQAARRTAPHGVCLDGVCRRHARRGRSRRTTSRSARPSATPTSSRSSRPSGSFAAHRRRLPHPDLPPEHRRGRGVDGLDAGVQRPLHAAEGVRRRAGCRRSRRALRRPSTSCRSTTSPTPSWS